MKTRAARLLFVALLMYPASAAVSAAATPAAATPAAAAPAAVDAGEWRVVAPGIEYLEATLPGPVQVYVARADRTVKNWTIDAMMAKGSAKGACETLPQMVERCDDTVNSRGEQYDAKIAVNGSYFNMTTGVPFGGEIVGGWFVRRFDEYSGGSGFFWTADRRAVMGGNVRNAAKWQQVIFADGTPMNIDKLNDPRGKDELAMYTWQYGEKTDTDRGNADKTGDDKANAAKPGAGKTGTGKTGPGNNEADKPHTTDDCIEVDVRMSAPTGIMPDLPGVPGEIVSVRQTRGGTALLYDHVVLSGSGAVAEKLRRLAKPGGQVRINLTLTDYGNEAIGLDPAEWKGAYASIPAATYILVKGKVPRHWEAKAARYAEQGKRHGSVVQDPRTLIAFNDRYVYFVVADGRSKQSIGMTFTEAGNFCRDGLKADYAVTQDGGGSSTMWVDGQVRNNPSGKPGLDKAGQLRPVANGYFMATVRPAERSDAFSAGSTVTTTISATARGDAVPRADAPGTATTGTAELRLGPGPQFGVAATLDAGRSGKVLPHPLTGVKTKGENWWNCRFGQDEGWVAERSLKRR